MLGMYSSSWTGHNTQCVHIGIIPSFLLKTHTLSLSVSLLLLYYYICFSPYFLYIQIIYIQHFSFAQKVHLLGLLNIKPEQNRVIQSYFNQQMNTSRKISKHVSPSSPTEKRELSNQCQNSCISLLITLAVQMCCYISYKY